MTAVTADLEYDRRIPFGKIRDTWAVTQRDLIHFIRIPLLIFSTIQPVIFVLLWRYVFGGAVRPTEAGVPYVDFLMPGIFVQTVVFGAIATAVGLAADLKSGMLERFLSLPMARSAVLVGRTLADLVRNVFVVILMVIVGFLVGSGSTRTWRPSSSACSSCCCSATRCRGCSRPSGSWSRIPRPRRRRPSRCSPRWCSRRRCSSRSSSCPGGCRRSPGTSRSRSRPRASGALDRRGDDPAGVADDLLVRRARGDLRADRGSPLPPGALGATETPRHLHGSPNPRC